MLGVGVDEHETTIRSARHDGIGSIEGTVIGPTKHFFDGLQRYIYIGRVEAEGHDLRLELG